MSVHVTEHAIDRYIERVAPVPREVARTTIASAELMIETAAAFGASVVRLGNGARLILTGPRPIRVVTVLSRYQIDHAHQLRPNFAQPASCGLCGLRAGHPIARACTRVSCPLSHAARTAAPAQKGAD